MTHRRMTSHDKGLWAEFLAALYLRLKGYRILVQRFKTPVGEVDIIARRGKTLVFIEVKQRASLAAALECVTAQMQTRISRAALFFLSSAVCPPHDHCRFDLITVSGLRIRHLDNAWVLPT
jgi:putative endonuclease